VNPELQRNLWLDATPRKLAFAGALLAGVFAAVWLIDRGRHASAITVAGAAVFAFAGLAWAPRAARRAVTGETVAGSWDFQRLTALTPWEMTWGKLLGATARPWAVAAGGLLLAVLQLASTTSVAHAAFWLLVALGLAVTVQASGLATGLIDVRRARASGRALSGRTPGLTLLALALLSLAAAVWIRLGVGRTLDRLGHIAAHPAPPQAEAMPVGWYGHPHALVGFAALSLVALAAWAVVWAWRLMRLELQYANAPWAWAGFLLCAGVYVFGFDPPPLVADPLAARLAATTGAWAVLAYVAAFAGPADRVRARQFAAAVRGRRPGRVLSHLPLTVLPSALAFAAGLGVAALHARADEGAAAIIMLAALGFFGRDLGVIAWRRFAGRGRQGDAGVLLFLIALYLVGGGLGWLLARGRGAALFAPSPAHPRLSLLSACLESASAWGLAALAVARPVAPLRAPRRWTRAPTPAGPGPTVNAPLAPTAVPVTDERP
jgi:hypothetical protein